MPPRKDADTIRPRIEALYQQPSGAFVASRNALASALKKEGLADAAERVKRLAKPSPGAWGINQVYWRDRPLYDRMLQAGDALRAIQHQMLSGRTANPRDAMTERQRALDAVVDRAAAFLRDDGNPVTAATRQLLQTTVDAVASYGSAADAYTPGQMIDDLDAPGFAALASLGGGSLRLVHGARGGAGASKGEPQAEARRGPVEAPPARKSEVDREAERRAEKQRAANAKREAAERAKAVKAAEQALRDATRELDTVRQRATRANSAAETLAQEQRTLEESLARLTARRKAADSAAVEASEAVSAAERTRRDAEAALVAARGAAQQG